MSAPVPISVDPAPVPNPVDPAEEDEDEEAAYSSSDSEGEEDTATERRPQFHTSAFIKFLTDATANALHHSRAEVQHPGLGLKHQVRNDALLYLAPPVFVRAPASPFGQKTVCKRSTDKVHHLRTNGWYDTVAYDLTGPVYLRRRNMLCQKEVNGKPACPEYKKGHVVRDEGLHWYPFVHTDKAVLAKGVVDLIINNCYRGLSLSAIGTSLREVQRREWLRRKTEFNANAERTCTERESHARLFSNNAGLSVAGFPSFESYAYVPSRGLIKINIVQYWRQHQAFYTWHMYNLGATKISADLTFKRAKFIVTKQGKRFVNQWKAVSQILNEIGQCISWAFTRNQATQTSQVEEVAARPNVKASEWASDNCCSERPQIQACFDKPGRLIPRVTLDKAHAVARLNKPLKKKDPGTPAISEHISAAVRGPGVGSKLLKAAESRYPTKQQQIDALQKMLAPEFSYPSQNVRTLAARPQVKET